MPGRLLAGEYPGHYDENTAREKLRSILDAGAPPGLLDRTELEHARGKRPEILHLRMPAKCFEELHKCGAETGGDSRRLPRSSDLR